MNRTMRVNVAACVLAAMGLAMPLAGCQSQKTVEKDVHSSGTSSGTRAMTATGSKTKTASGFGIAPDLALVRIQSALNAEKTRNFDYAYTLRSEIAGSKAEPKGSQGVDLGDAGASTSKFCLNLDRGFAVIGGCFPKYVPPLPIPDGDKGMLPPRPWPTVIVNNVLASTAEGTKFSVYIETTNSGDYLATYIFRHDGGPVHAWMFLPGTNPQIGSGTTRISYDTNANSYIKHYQNTAGTWVVQTIALPAAGSSDPARKYFEACNDVASDLNISFPSCAVQPVPDVQRQNPR